MFLAADPVDLRVVSDGVMGRVNEDDFKEFESGVLSDPVGVKHSESGQFSSYGLLSHGLVVLVSFEPGDTDGLDFTANYSFLGGSLSVTSSYSYSVDNVSLFSSITQSTSSLHS